MFSTVNLKDLTDKEREKSRKEFQNKVRTVKDWAQWGQDKLRQGQRYLAAEAQAEVDAAAGNWTTDAIRYQRRQDAYYDLASRLFVLPNAEQLGVPVLLRGGQWERDEQRRLLQRGRWNMGTRRMLARIYERGTNFRKKRYTPKKYYYYRKNYYYMNKPRFMFKKRKNKRQYRHHFNKRYQ